jgi:hypothetical protein
MHTLSSTLAAAVALVIALTPSCRAWPAGVDDTTCATLHLSDSEYAGLKAFVEANPVAIVALDSPMRCTIAARDRMRTLGACFDEMIFSDESYSFGVDATISAPLWKYHVCQYPDNKVGNAQMHSYVWIGGQMRGNGFDFLPSASDWRVHPGRFLTDAALSQELDGANASRACGSADGGAGHTRRRARELYGSKSAAASTGPGSWASAVLTAAFSTWAALLYEALTEHRV